MTEPVAYFTDEDMCNLANAQGDRIRELEVKLSAALDRAEKAERSEAAMLNHVQAVEKERHGNDGRRWNMHRSGDDEIQVCFGHHERGAACQYQTFSRSSREDSHA